MNIGTVIVPFLCNDIEENAENCNISDKSMRNRTTNSRNTQVKLIYLQIVV